MELVRATEAAAISSYRWIGRGEKNLADKAAVDAMRTALSSLQIDGRIVIGEGEKDKAPMLFRGERIGTAIGPALDIAVDPIDGTSLTATGRRNALSVIAASGVGTMLDASTAYYMKKIVTDHTGRGVVDLRQPIEVNVVALAKAKGVTVSELQVVILDRPRHSALVSSVRATGASTRLISDGDVAAGINAARSDSPIDMAVGIGGSPEGVATACALKALGGYMQAQLLPNDPNVGAVDDTLDYERVWERDDLVKGETLFVATGVTSGDLLDGVTRTAGAFKTESIILRSVSGTIRRIRGEHRAENWS